MDLGITGKRALVTGSSRGIGRAAAGILAAEGAAVALVARTATEVFSARDALGGEARGHFATALDLCEEHAPQRLVEQLGAFGMPDIVVHNLGGSLRVRETFASIADWRRVARLNFEVALELDALLIPGMMDRGWGRVVYVGSLAGIEHNASIPYSVAKAATLAYVRAMARTIAPKGVVMSAVLPGTILTEASDWNARPPEAVEKFLAERTVLRRFGTPEEIAHAIAFLCSEQAAFCSGSVLSVDGGQGVGFQGG